MEFLINSNKNYSHNMSRYIQCQWQCKFKACQQWILKSISDVFKCGGVTKEKVSYFQVGFCCICFNAALIITPNHCVHRMKSFQPKHKQELFAAMFWRWVFISQDNKCRSKYIVYSLWDKVLVIVFSSFFQVSTDVCFIKIDFHEFLLESGNTKFLLI